MLERINLQKRLSRQEYRRVLPRLQQRLGDLQQACWESRVPSIVVFEGWDAAGKGSAVGVFTASLDPRKFKLHNIQAPGAQARERPWMARFWQRLPAYGEMVLFHGSWYRRVLADRVEGLVPERDWRRAYRDIVEFERMLVDDGAVIIKFFLHISRDEQRRRLEKLQKKPSALLQVQPEQWDQHRRYEDYLLAVQEMLERTDSEWAPWTIVEAQSRRYARQRILAHAVARLESYLAAAAAPPTLKEQADQAEEASNA